MRLLIVVPSLVRAGAETQAVELANGLAEIGHEVHLCSFERQLDQCGRLSDAVRYHHVSRKSKYDLSLLPRLAEVIDRERIDVIQGVLLFASLIATLAARYSLRRPPVVAAIHATINTSRKYELVERVLYRRMLRHLPAVIFVSDHQRDLWIRKYPELEQSARVVHNGLDPERFRRTAFVNSARELRVKLGIPSQAFVFSCIAGFRPEKGHECLIEAFARLPTSTYLLLAGDGETRPIIEAAVRSAGLDERVRFLGDVCDVRPVIVASDATVLSSMSETFSMAMLESMALGVPMIAPRIGGLPEAILPGETGLLFEAGVSRELERGMRTLVADRAMTERMGKAAQSLVAASFTRAAMLAKNEKVLLDMQQSRLPKRHQQ